MVRFFLLPLLLTILWTLFLFHYGLSFKQGLKGYYWIIGISSALIGFFSLMIWLTH
ncbi:hypothetical protein OAG1_13020 [Agarivorans sp. OAG1]|uniref:Uncharacterized protein n=1 Tax=Agarivorans albus MKT 106 TaxID=1331007 RepID=R9PUH8_AGAAL|nr:hypothetical protein [Agarivorans albus]BEU02502.1 hypothetical protein OAG1_13020 [Agarivorans sp. OAG1]GAD04196.1 hypothetical protein AALB_4276 [Agarivorans albus MKT 106]